MRIRSSRRQPSFTSSSPIMSDKYAPTFDQFYYDKYGQPISRERWTELWMDEANYGPAGHHGGYRRIGWWDGEGGISVSTVWTGIDHGFRRPGDLNYKPIIFETMIFGPVMDQEMTRYCTLEEAVEGHARTVENICRGEPVWFTV